MVESPDPRDLVERLQAALDEFERVAREAVGHEGAANWTQVDPEREPGRIEDGHQVITYDESAPTEAQAAHIALHDPAHVLRTIQAHRKILDRHHTGGQSPWTGDMGQRCVSCFQSSPCETVRDLASIYFPESDG